MTDTATSHTPAYRRILVPMDGSRQCDRALDEATALARSPNGVEAAVELVEEGAGGIPQIVGTRAAQWPADLVVVGTHGRHGIDRLLLGSVAEAILRRCPVPGLLVKTAGDVDEPVAIA